MGCGRVRKTERTPVAGYPGRLGFVPGAHQFPGARNLVISWNVDRTHGSKKKRTPFDVRLRCAECFSAYFFFLGWHLVQVVGAALVLFALLYFL